MLNVFWYGLEFSILAIIIVLATLFLLALMLMLYSKIFSGKESPPKQGDGGQAGKAAPVNKNLAGAKDQLVPAVPLTGEKPEIVAAAMGALLFTMERGRSLRPAVAKVTGGERIGGWEHVGRSRLLQLRQDFVISKRGKVK